MHVLESGTFQVTEISSNYRITMDIMDIMDRIDRVGSISLVVTVCGD